MGSNLKPHQSHTCTRTHTHFLPTRNIETQEDNCASSSSSSNISTTRRMSTTSSSSSGDGCMRYQSDTCWFESTVQGYLTTSRAAACSSRPSCKRSEWTARTSPMKECPQHHLQDTTALYCMYATAMDNRVVESIGRQLALTHTILICISAPLHINPSASWLNFD